MSKSFYFIFGFQQKTCASDSQLSSFHHCYKTLLFYGNFTHFPCLLYFLKYLFNIFFFNFRVNTYLFNSVTLKFWPRIWRIQNYIHNNLRKVHECKNRWRCICKSRFSPVDGRGWVIKGYLSFSGGHLVLIISLCKF